MGRGENFLLGRGASRGPQGSLSAQDERILAQLRRYKSVSLSSFEQLMGHLQEDDKSEACHLMGVSLIQDWQKLAPQKDEYQKDEYSSQAEEEREILTPILAKRWMQEGAWRMREDDFAAIAKTGVCGPLLGRKLEENIHTLIHRFQALEQLAFSGEKIEPGQEPAMRELLECLPYLSHLSDIKKDLGGILIDWPDYATNSSAWKSEVYNPDSNFEGFVDSLVDELSELVEFDNTTKFVLSVLSQAEEGVAARALEAGPDVSIDELSRRAKESALRELAVHIANSPVGSYFEDGRDLTLDDWERAVIAYKEAWQDGADTEEAFAKALRA